MVIPNAIRGWKKARKMRIRILSAIFRVRRITGDCRDGWGLPIRGDTLRNRYVSPGREKRCEKLRYATKNATIVTLFSKFEVQVGLLKPQKTWGKGLKSCLSQKRTSSACLYIKLQKCQYLALKITVFCSPNSSKNTRNLPPHYTLHSTLQYSAWWNLDQSASKTSLAGSAGITEYQYNTVQFTVSRTSKGRCTVLYLTVLYYTVLYCTVLYCTLLYCTVLYCTVLYCTLMYCTVLYLTVLYCTLLYCTVRYCTVLYCTVLYVTVLYCTLLYCTVPYCRVKFGLPDS